MTHAAAGAGGAENDGGSDLAGNGHGSGAGNTHDQDSLNRNNDNVPSTEQPAQDQANEKLKSAADGASEMEQPPPTKDASDAGPAKPEPPADDVKKTIHLGFDTLGEPPKPKGKQVTKGQLLSARADDKKGQLLNAQGGGEDTEAAVQAALEWLARNQLRDGAWSLRGPYSAGGSIENRVSATAMALLAFLGAGNTPAKGRFKGVVRKGVGILGKSQRQDGIFLPQSGLQGGTYGQAQATIVFCELYGMTKDRHVRTIAQRAIQYTIHAQSPQGGWRYAPRTDSDTSVTGWYAMAVQSALMAKLQVPKIVFNGVAGYLDTAAVDGGSKYGYLAGGTGAKPSMTAEALLCRQYLGWSRDDQRLTRGVAFLHANPMRWGSVNVYYWYYGTQVMHNMGGADWSCWNDTMKPVLLDHQVRKGPERGSWPPERDAYALAGRLYVTCLCTWMLETYYRYLPIYSKQAY